MSLVDERETSETQPASTCNTHEPTSSWLTIKRLLHDRYLQHILVDVCKDLRDYPSTHVSAILNNLGLKGWLCCVDRFLGREIIPRPTYSEPKSITFIVQREAFGRKFMLMKRHCKRSGFELKGNIELPVLLKGVFETEVNLPPDLTPAQLAIYGELRVGEIGVVYDEDKNLFILFERDQNGGMKGARFDVPEYGEADERPDEEIKEVEDNPADRLRKTSGRFAFEVVSKLLERRDISITQTCSSADVEGKLEFSDWLDGRNRGDELAFYDDGFNLKLGTLRRGTTDFKMRYMYENEQIVLQTPDSRQEFDAADPKSVLEHIFAKNIIRPANHPWVERANQIAEVVFGNPTTGVEVVLAVMTSDSQIPVGQNVFHYSFPIRESDRIHKLWDPVHSRSEKIIAVFENGHHFFFKVVDKSDKPREVLSFDKISVFHELGSGDLSKALYEDGLLYEMPYDQRPTMCNKCNKIRQTVADGVCGVCKSVGNVYFSDPALRLSEMQLTRLEENLRVEGLPSTMANRFCHLEVQDLGISPSYH